jgi:NAD(P)-dependent dehydrogenase (short-subunit alcohol dehydrogenase family)
MSDITKDPNPLYSLSGKTAIITGGSRGLGKSMSQAFARAGAQVVIASRKVDACEALAKELENETGNKCIGVAFHAGKWEDCDTLSKAAFDAFGTVEILVNNAGMSPLYDSLINVTQELYDKVLNVNLRGPFRLSSILGTHMAENNGGSIINVSSTSSVQPTKNELPYAAAKAGVNAMTVGLARSFGPTVRTNCIMPGPFLTDISNAWDMEAFNARAKTNIPLQRGGEPEEIAGAALYLASDASSYTTGSIIKIDGGSAFAPA